MNNLFLTETFLPQTGEASGMWLWIAGIIIVLAGLGLLFSSRRKK
mgnify:CR=1 FL=1